MIKDALKNTGSKVERSSFLPDAFSLYSLYDESGLCPAITACIQDAQSDLIESISKTFGGVNLNYKPPMGK